MSESLYRLKAIDTITPSGKKQLKILCQAANGPCPLIALCNVLLLRGDIKINQDKSMVSFKELTDELGNYLLSKQEENVESPTSPSTRHENMNTVLELLPTLETGLIVNVDHSSIHGFEEDRALLLFRTFNVDLVHAWLADPVDAATWNVIVTELGGMYEQVQAKGLEGMDEELLQSQIEQLAVELSAAPEDDHDRLGKELAEKSKLLEDSRLCRDFLNSTGAQMTLNGLTKLRNDLKPEGLYVLYHSSHFSTMYVKSSHQLLLLVTDEGLARTNKCVWQTLDDVMGMESLFLDGNLDPFVHNPDEEAEEARRQGAAIMPQEEIDALIAKQEGISSDDPDFAVALALQAQENSGRFTDEAEEERLNRRIAQRLQAEEDERLAREIQNQEYEIQRARQPSQPPSSIPASNPPSSQPVSSQPLPSQQTSQVSSQPAPPESSATSPNKGQGTQKTPKAKKDKECRIS